MEKLTEQLTDTATILENLPKVLDLATSRELGMLARIFHAYVKFEGPREYGVIPGYLEHVLASVMVEEDRRGGVDWDADRHLTEINALRHMIVGSAIDFAQRISDEGEHCLLRDVIHLAAFGEEVDNEPERRPVTVRQAFERMIVELDAKQAAEGKAAGKTVAISAKKAKRKAA